MPELIAGATKNTRTSTAAVTFGARLRAARRSAGLSRKQAARILGGYLPHWEISLKEMEKGHYDCTSTIVIADLCAVYAIPRSWLDAEPLLFVSDDHAISAFTFGLITPDDLKRWFRIERALGRDTEGGGDGSGE